MHRKIFTLLFLFVVCIVSAQDNTFVLKGSFSEGGFNNKKVYIQKFSEDMHSLLNVDSVIIRNDSFIYNGVIKDNTPSILFVSVPETNGGGMRAFFIPESGEILLLMGDNTVVGGTPRNQEVQAFMNSQSLLIEELDRVAAKYSNADLSTATQIRRMDETKLIMDRLKVVTYDFTKSNIKNDVGEYLLLSFYHILSPDQILALLDQSRPQFKRSKLGQNVLNYCEVMVMRNGGGKYKDIKLRTPEGRDTSLSDYVGKHKVVLIDFWASWCGPCLREMPNLVRLYETYKDKGLEIVGISLDDNPQSWKRAIERLNITWTQMSDLKGWQSDAARLYAVSSIPYTLLVDKNGVIIASFLYGEKLFEKVKELLD